MTILPRLMKTRPVATTAALLLGLVVGTAMSSGARADEADAKRLLQAMFAYVGSQKSISFQYDANLEVVTKDKQRLSLASSGAVSLGRPDKIRATRSGGFVDVETVFDGKTLTVLGKGKNIYVQVDIPGTVDHLIDELKDKYHRPLPAADLLLSDGYDQMMAEVIDVKDLGSGVIGGTECDYLAFRTKEVDWQIWIAQGDRPHPCRFVITSKLIDGSPQYSIQVRDWKVGEAAAVTDFSFKPPTGATKVDVKDLKSMKEMGELPSHFTIGGGR
jgi:hypothetical protein